MCHHTQIEKLSKVFDDLFPHYKNKTLLLYDK